ncbi:hypothetical protein TPA0907_31330 [Micromonospora humidisoli]|nr:hypothetical protein TPA0907_31330 [Micromonospora sp. AKA109]
MDSEVLRDLLDGHARVTVTGHPHDVIAELTRVGLGHSNILPAHRQGKPSQMSPIGAADPSWEEVVQAVERPMHRAFGGGEALVSFL